MRLGRSITRPARLLGAVGFALLLAGCSEQPTAPDVVKLAPATAGSIIKSDVVTITTVCLKLDKCNTSTRSDEIREKVAGNTTPRLRAALAIVAGENGEPTADQWGSLGQISNVHISGRNLALDIAKNGKVWHVEMTHDAVAKSKVSSLRLSVAGKPLIAQNARWKDVSGVWYREHSDMSVFHAGRLAVRTEKTFTPTEVLPPDASDHSTESLTIRAVCGTEIAPDGSDGCVMPGGCPQEFEPICEWFQAGNNPIPILGGIVGALGNVAQWVSNFLGTMWAADDGYDTSMQIAQQVAAYMEAWVNPSLYTIATAIGTSAGDKATETLLEAMALEMIEWLELAGWLTL